ncbi:MAG: hypothetical protein KGJ90_02435 [Patescibacteria group bacterium]|nr:hypothetical protein [Patescibacteria group bacterium]
MKRVKIVKIDPHDSWYDCRDILEGKEAEEYQGNIYVDKATLRKLKSRGWNNPIVLSTESKTEEIK